MDRADRAAMLRRIEEVIGKGRFRDSWESLSQFRVPAWYRDAKFGIFIHWGVYSVPAFANEWYSRNMYIQGTPEFEHHVKTYGPQREFGYKDFIPLFRAEKFRPEEWADLFREAGARYVVPVAEHHDGFQMYASDLSEWNAAEKGPCRDVLGELKTALEARGMRMGASSHRFEHWFFMGHGKEFDSDIREPLRRGDFYWPAMPEPANLFDTGSEPVPSPEFMEDWLLRCCEIVDRLQPRLVYFDWWIQHDALKPWLRKFAAYYYNRAEEWGFEGIITYKHEAFMFGCAVPDVERGQLAEAKPYFWQTDTAIARNSWCYTEQNDYKSPGELIRNLIDAVSKNGILLLNVGPKADGSIGPEDARVLRTIGSWLKINGEAIYGASSWRFWGEGPTRTEEGQFTDGQEMRYTPEDFRFTVNHGQIYAFSMAFPKDGRITIRSLGKAGNANSSAFQGTVREVSIPGQERMPEWSQEEDGLRISAPFAENGLPVAFRIRVE